MVYFSTCGLITPYKRATIVRKAKGENLSYIRESDVGYFFFIGFSVKGCVCDLSFFLLFLFFCTCRNDLCLTIVID